MNFVGFGFSFLIHHFITTGLASRCLNTKCKLYTAVPPEPEPEPNPEDCLEEENCNPLCKICYFRKTSRLNKNIKELVTTFRKNYLNLQLKADFFDMLYDELTDDSAECPDDVLPMDPCIREWMNVSEKYKKEFLDNCYANQPKPLKAAENEDVGIIARPAEALAVNPDLLPFDKEEVEINVKPDVDSIPVLQPSEIEIIAKPEEVLAVNPVLQTEEFNNMTTENIPDLIL